MLTLALYGLLAIGLMVGLFLLAVQFLPAGEQIAPPLRDEPVWMLPPDRVLNAADVAELRLPVALRGYRFAETDELLDRVVEELKKRDEKLDHLYRVLIALPPEVMAGIPPLPGEPAEEDATEEEPTEEDATEEDATEEEPAEEDAAEGEPAELDLPTDPAPHGG